MAGSKFAGSLSPGSAWNGVAVYGTEGVAAPGNTPGAREASSGWADPSGNLWLFGGSGFSPVPAPPEPPPNPARSPWSSDRAGTAPKPSSTASPTLGQMNDLWKFTPSTGEWTWMAGSNQVNQYGTYGTLGTPAPGNTPGARSWPASWTDAAGNLWLFGGLGLGASEQDQDTGCEMNDLWMYGNGGWTWVGGPDEPDCSGVYGTEGVAAPGNLPPPRDTATTWTDTEGNLWLFGGADLNPFNDLWKYSNGEWTWMSGSDQVCQEPGVYGTLGVPSAANVPGARVGAAAWTDKQGNLWLFGGDIINCPGYPTEDKFNDFWEYQP